MPLARRLAKELLPDWIEHNLKYKELQREAEELVGAEGANVEENAAVFQFHLSFAVEQCNAFYVEKEVLAKEAFDNVARAVQAVAQVHLDREAKINPVGACKEKEIGSPDSSPTTSTDNVWSMGVEITEEELETLGECFEMWKKYAHTHRRHVLADYINDKFMGALEQGALKAALMDWLKLLMFIDHIRNFAMLNTVAALKLIDRHSPETTQAPLHAALEASEMYLQRGLSDVIEEMQDVALKLSMCLSNAVEQPSGTPKAWSAHVCPFCSHTVVNAVIMPAGRTCCFKCAVASSSSCIFTCPITGKTQDIRGLRGERVLSKFLQRYFPQAYQTGPGEITGNSANVAKDTQVQERAAHGILSMFKAAEDKKIAEMAKQKKEQMKREQMQHASRREGLTIAIPDKDGAAERDCWVGICNTPSSAGGSTPSPRSRRSGGRTPRSSIGSTEGFDFEFLGSAVQGMLQKMHEEPLEKSKFGARYIRGGGVDAGGMNGRRDRSISMPCTPGDLSGVLGSSPGSAPGRTNSGGRGSGPPTMWTGAMGSKSPAMKPSLQIRKCTDLASLAGDD